MTIKTEVEAQILRYYHVEKWRCGTIARQLHVHRGTVQRVLAQACLPRMGGLQRPSRIDPYLPFIHETLKKFPSLTASRLYAMVTERGYRGNIHHFRHLVALHRPRPTPEAYLRLRTMPGEVGEVDWAAFGHLQIGRARRPLMAFVMVLSWSRQIWLRFFLNARMDSFLAGHVGAFEAWSGVPRVLKYDNLRSAVLERQGDAIRFNPALLAFASHYRFEPRPVAVARGNEKEFVAYCTSSVMIGGIYVCSRFASSFVLVREPSGSVDARALVEVLAVIVILECLEQPRPSPVGNGGGAFLEILRYLRGAQQSASTQALILGL
ncbi:integrase catalytic subunit [Caballeronia glebae]|uniref:Integrase catalytic subunit n=1 Tax=Caballeronia glebae TaxID=1777143 RepID=A0A158BKI7_9BURK|nr:integrase catalytic subunit [Caballeronia glebae]